MDLLSSDDASSNDEMAGALDSVKGVGVVKGLWRLKDRAVQDDSH